MKKREASFADRFGRWIRSNGRLMGSGPYEIKSSRGRDYVPFSAVEEHQEAALLACTTDTGFWYKISDESRGFKPFDGFFFRNSPAFLVFDYPEFFAIMHIGSFVRERAASIRKSLTSERAKDISVRVVYR